MRAGRARCSIENETFNTLLIQGYNLEHNYGHGKQHLATVLVVLMFLHFLIDQVQELACPLFQAALHRFHSRMQFWETLRGRFLSHFIPDWLSLFKSIIYDLKADVIQFDTGVVKIRLFFGCKVDPVFIPARKNNSLVFCFHQKNSIFTIHYSPKNGTRV